MRPITPVLATNVLLELVGAMDDTIAGSHLVYLVVLPREPGALEHEDDLLRRAVRVRQGRQLARSDA